MYTHRVHHTDRWRQSLPTVPLNGTEWQTVTDTHTHSQVKKERELTVPVNWEQSSLPSPCTGGMRHHECPSSLQTQTRSSNHHTHPSSLHIQTHTEFSHYMITSEHVPLVEFTYLVFTCMPGERVTIGDSGLEDVPLVEFMYLVFTWWKSYSRWLRSRGCTSGGVYVPCVYLVK